MGVGRVEGGGRDGGVGRERGGGGCGWVFVGGEELREDK